MTTKASVIACISNKPGCHLLLGLLFLIAFSSTARAQSGNYNGLNYTTSGGAVTITGYTGPNGPVVIPSTINNLPVTTIGTYAFSFTDSTHNPTSVTIPNTVHTIDAYASTNAT